MKKTFPKIIVLAHHKTGSLFWNRILKRLQKKFELNLLTIQRKYFDEELNDFIYGNWDICLQTHSSCSLKYVENIDFRCVHSIRNAANVIVSALKYHKFNKDEKWLQKKRKNFGGLSYQEKILKFKNLEKELTFEMNHASRYTIENMAKITKDNSNQVLNVDLDIVSSDKEMKDFKNLFYFLRLEQLDNFNLQQWINLGKKEFLWNQQNLKNKPKLAKHITRSDLANLLDNRFLFNRNNKHEFKRIFGLEIYNNTFIN